MRLEPIGASTYTGGMTRVESDSAPLMRLALASVLFTVALGVLLRLAMVSVVPLPGDFAHLRHAHSHAGYFGLLFPLVWIAWAQAGAPMISRALALVYAAATAVACIGFAMMGYRHVTIVASTLLGAVWVAAAFRARGLVRDRVAWIGVGPVFTVLACLWIAPIGIVTPKDPVLGARFAHSFLALLLFSVVLPAGLSRLGAPRLPAWLWSPLALAASLDVGALPHRVFGVALALYGVLLGWSGWRARTGLVERLAFVVFGVSSALFGLRAVELSPPLAVAGTHFAILGPALLSLLPARTRADALLLGAAAATMAGVLALAPLLAQPVLVQGLAALSGVLALVPVVRALWPEPR